MAAKTQQGYLVIGDISGFTSYLAGTELEHAHEILGDLLESIIHSFKTLLTISKLEGDAVFAYTPIACVERGELLAELLDATYVAFRDRVEAAHRRTTCECNACRNIPTLDLKFFVHTGDYILQTVAGNLEVVGSDVNLVHRLMKNHVAEATGWRAYALFTQAALQKMAFQPGDGHAQAENYEHLGDVDTLSLNLHPRYAEIIAKRHIAIAPEDSHLTWARDYPVTPAVAWEWLNAPEKVSSWTVNRHMQAGFRPNGRLGVGAKNHCVHGKNTTMIETILDWRPFEHFTVAQISKGLPMDFYATTTLEPIEGGTRVQVLNQIKFRFPLPKPWVKPLAIFFLRLFQMEKDYDTLATMIAQPPAAVSEAG